MEYSKNIAGPKKSIISAKYRRYYRFFSPCYKLHLSCLMNFSQAKIMFVCVCVIYIYIYIYFKYESFENTFKINESTFRKNIFRFQMHLECFLQEVQVTFFFF